VTSSIVSRPLQKAFLTIPQSPLCYWLRPRFFELLAGKTLGDVADVVQGLATADDARFVRFVWEAPPPQYGIPVRSRRWVPFEKGGGYGKWFGHHWWVVDWEHGGARIKAFPGSVVRNENYYFREGWTYSALARGSLGFRRMDSAGVFAHVRSDGVFARNSDARAIGALINTRISSYLVRSLRAQIVLTGDYVSRIPFLNGDNNDVPRLEALLCRLKKEIIGRDPTEATCNPVTVHVGRKSDRGLPIVTLLHTLEGIAEQLLFSLYGLSDDDLAAVLEDTGTPSGWFPLVIGFEQLPSIPEGLPALPYELSEYLSHHKRLRLSDRELSDIRLRLRALYEAGPGASADEEESLENDDEENEQIYIGARIPIPTETFLEELSHKLEIHPISVYWLLKEGIEREGWRCLPEERRLACERITVMILRLLGHQWPTQIEAGEPVPDWADADGIIPLTGGTGESTLLERLRERIAADFDGDTPGSFERHFAEVMGKPLEQWLETEFFKYLISLLRKRPIAWQIQSGRYAKKRKPAFACLAYYHKLDGDLIPKIRAQYVGPLRQKWETELRGIEEVPDRSRSDRQDARLVELEELIAELKEFDERLKEVMDKGFGCGKLEELLARERPDKWCSIDGELPPPMDRESFLAQEGRYLPDLNDGVRVNIAPLQKAGLLAAEVLARKDIEVAIADRAEWRSDERHWCREGKLPHPGWWQKGATDGTR